jgi:hypothetical protein
MRGRGAALALVVIAVGASIVGCGHDDHGTYRVDGRVTWKGQPVPNGLIRFEPDASAGNKGPGAIAPIEQGRYATARGKGVVGGRYQVILSGYDGVPFESPGEGFLNTVGKPLFVNRVEEVDFPREPCTRDFDLTAP